MHKIGLTLFLGGLAACGAFAAEQGGPHPCAAIEAPGERLACYDEAFGGPRPSVASSPAAEVAAPPSPPAPVQAAAAAAGPAAVATSAGRGEEDFGLSEAQLREREPDKAGDEGPKSIEAVVTGIEYLPTRERVITLDNGQVWRETEVVTRARLAVGDPVTIKDAAFSSFLMVGPSARAVRVRRVK